MLDVCFIRSVLANSRMTVPIMSKIGAKKSGLKNDPHSDMETSQPVIVVPMLAPMIIPMAWLRSISRALTNPTTMTVVAEDDWIMAVIKAPTSTPTTRLLVSIASSFLVFAPADFCNPSAISCIP